MRTTISWVGRTILKSESRLKLRRFRAIQSPRTGYSIMHVFHAGLDQSKLIIQITCLPNTVVIF